MDDGRLDELAGHLGGHGCVIRHGHLCKSWGDSCQKLDWMSSAKPVFSTLLFFAIQEERVSDVDALLLQWGWALEGKDRRITFRHLANMISGYARKDPPGTAWAYNDFAIQLYQRTLFERIFRGSPEMVLTHPRRLGLASHPMFASHRYIRTTHSAARMPEVKYLSRCLARIR